MFRRGIKHRMYTLVDRFMSYWCDLVLLNIKWSTFGMCLGYGWSNDLGYKQILLRNAPDMTSEKIHFAMQVMFQNSRCIVKGHFHQHILQVSLIEQSEIWKAAITNLTLNRMTGLQFEVLVVNRGTTQYSQLTSRDGCCKGSKTYQMNKPTSLEAHNRLLQI